MAMETFASIEGRVPIRADRGAFLGAFGRRLEAGLVGDPRSSTTRYAATRRTADGLDFRAAAWLTAVNVGLNDVELSASEPGSVRYRVRYGQWARAALVFCGAAGAGFLVLLLTYDLRGYLARQPDRWLIGLSPGQGVVLAWAMAVFWGFAWPWVLILLHRGPLRRLIERLIREVDADAAGYGVVATDAPGTQS